MSCVYPLTMAIAISYQRLKVALHQSLGRSKRVIFMTSLYLEMIRDHDPSKDSLADLNRNLRLVHDSKKLVFPAVMRPLVWKDPAALETVDRELSCGDINGVCATVLSITPKWLQYGDKSDDMIRDIQTVAQKVSGMAVAR